ncbi:MAG: hypothetical protein HOV83_06890 [Catenulispora sp.]|nr:hypothetical protein [Catenulispora sp.]
MSGISGSGRHVASHAKPGKISSAKGKVKTAAAVGSVLAVSGGVAGALHLQQEGQRNSAEAASQDSKAAAAAARALAARAGNTPEANRDLQRADLNAGGATTPGAAADGTTTTSTQPGTPTPTSDSSSTLLPSLQSPSSAVGTTSTTSTTPTTRPSTPTTSTTSKPTTTPTPTKTTTPAPSTSSSSSVGMGYNATPAQAQAIAKQLVPTSQYACFANIIERESSWNLHATNPSSGAYGLGQALPGDKMAPYGSDWRNSATVQIKWALAYMTGRYGSPCAAWTFWQNHSWY